MSKTISISIVLIASLALLGCSGQKPAAEKPTEVSSTTQKESLLDEVTDAEDDFVPAPEYNHAMNQVMEASAYSSSLDSSWETMKGMDYSKKEALLKQAKGLASEAGKKIGSLKQLGSIFGGKTSQELDSMISSLEKQLGGLKHSISRGADVDASGWPDYKDQVGSAISALSGGFSNLRSLAQ